MDERPADEPSFWSNLLQLRRPLPRWTTIGMSALFLLLVWGLWGFVTAGDVAEERIVSPIVLPSPAETFDTFHDLWFDRALTRNVIVTLKRALLGFLLATAVGIPLGVLCGCFPLVMGFFMPLTIFGRNIPLAALIPLTFFIFDVGEMQKVMFIFIACVMFITWDVSVAIRDVHQRYVDTAYTLGAKTRHIVMKVLVPLAMPLAVLLASLMTFGNLAENLELLAFKSSGISLFRIMTPVIIQGFVSLEVLNL